MAPQLHALAGRVAIDGPCSVADPDGIPGPADAARLFLLLARCPESPGSRLDEYLRHPDVPAVFRAMAAAGSDRCSRSLDLGDAAAGGSCAGNGAAGRIRDRRQSGEIAEARLGVVRDSRSPVV